MREVECLLTIEIPGEKPPIHRLTIEISDSGEATIGLGERL
jgi:hypothetical protein